MPEKLLKKMISDIKQRKRLLYLMLAAFCVAVMAVCHIGMISRADENEFLFMVSSLLGVITVGSVISVLIHHIDKESRTEQIRVHSQKKEIEYLSRARKDFYASIGRQISSPIADITAINDTILRTPGVPEEIQANNANIKAAGRMLLTLIDDILDMNRIQSGNLSIDPGEYDTVRLLRDIVGIIRPRAVAKGLELNVLTDPDIPVGAVGDEVRIKQIMVNLLTNAVKYTANGSVTLSVGGTFKEDGRFVFEYTVSDTGMGIREEDMERLFSSFARVDIDKNQGVEGTGLGLYISKSLAELMGGDLKASSEYGKGSDFTAIIPQSVADGRGIGDISFTEDAQLSLFEADELCDGTESEGTAPVSKETKLPVIITTESTSGITEELAEAFDIQVLPLVLKTPGGGRFSDYGGAEAESLKGITSVKGMSASLPEPEEIKRFFGEVLNKAERVIHLSPGGTQAEDSCAVIQNAVCDMEAVTVINSGMCQSGLFLLALSAAYSVRNGRGPEEVLEDINAARKSLIYHFMSEDDASPYTELQTISGVLAKKKRRAKKASFDDIIDRISVEENISPEIVCISASGMADAELGVFRQRLLNIRKFITVYSLDNSPASAAIWGNRTISVAVFKETD